MVPLRSLLVDGQTKPAVDSVKALTKIYPLAQADNPPPLTFVDITGRDGNSIAPANYQFWEFLNQVVQEEPTDALDRITLGIWASIGIQKGKPFNPDARMKKILEEAATVGDATARANNYRMRAKEAYFYPDSPWRTGFLGGYKFEDNGALILDSALGYYFYATGVTSAMDSSAVGQGSQYMAAFVDSGNRPLDLQAPSSHQYPGGQLLVGHPLRQPDPLHAPDRPALAGGRQPDHWTVGQSGQFGGKRPV